MTHYPKENYIKYLYKRVAIAGKQIDSISFYVIANFPLYDIRYQGAYWQKP